MLIYARAWSAVSRRDDSRDEHLHCARRSKSAVTHFGNTFINYFPGGGAIRAVSRYVIFLTLPMSIAFAYGLQKALQFAAGKQALTVAVLVVAAFGVFEQFGVAKVNGDGFLDNR